MWSKKEDLDPLGKNKQIHDMNALKWTQYKPYPFTFHGLQFERMQYKSLVKKEPFPLQIYKSTYDSAQSRQWQKRIHTAVNEDPIH